MGTPPRQQREQGMGYLGNGGVEEEVEGIDESTFLLLLASTRVKKSVRTSIVDSVPVLRSLVLMPRAT